MPRTTRSRKVAIAEDDTALAINTPLPDTPLHNPHVLIDANASLASNNFTTMNDVFQAEVEGLKAAYKNVLGVGKKLKKSKGKKKGTQDLEDIFAGEQENTAQVNASSLIGGPGSPMRQSRKEVAIMEESQEMPPQPAVRATRHQAAKAQAAKEQAIAQDILNNREALSTPIQPPTYKEASGLQGTNESGISRTPIGSPVKTLEEVERDCGADETATLADDAGEDSFVHQITCRSPAKPVSRIEDSVEALDQLEEAIEALGQAALAEAIMSPAKTRKKSPLRGDSLERKNVSFQPEPKVLLHQSGGKQQAPRAGFATVRMKTAPKQAPTLKKAASMNFTSGSSNAKSAEAEAKAPPPARAPVKRPISLLPPKETTKSTKAPTRSTFELPGEAVAQKLKEQREARLAQRQSSEDSFYTARVVSGPKVKSTKPPTKPTFELPGEELSRRKRAAHEARLRAQEEEERKRREFKAKPIRNSNVPNMVPRETIASRARQSKIGMEGLEEGNFSVAKRGSNIGAHRPTISQLNLANTSAPRTKGAATLTRKPSLTVHGPSMSGRAMQRSVSVTDIQVQRQRAKEIYNREARMAEDMEREKRDREIAAKRAREEAAERGRQASREWAERQMARKLAEGDKGLSAGYGPGGQLGLSG